jgi:hypothetical protein
MRIIILLLLRIHYGSNESYLLNRISVAKMMPMKNLRNYLFLIPYLIAVGVGLKFGYDFGMQISGPIMAVITAIIGAVFCSIIVESFLGKKRKNDS